MTTDLVCALAVAAGVGKNYSAALKDEPIED
jgi:hypothetical protein